MVDAAIVVVREMDGKVVNQETGNLGESMKE